LDCGSSNVKVALPHGRLCWTCKHRRHRDPQPCPACAQIRPLAWVASNAGSVGLEVCAECAGAASVFACKACGSEEHPYSYSRCARCYVRELLTEILTDPATDDIHHRLQPVFDLLVNSPRPASTYWWLTKPGTVAPTILAAMAAGQLPISHDPFREQFPMDRRHSYLRDLLTSTGVLPPYTLAIERIGPWLTEIVAEHTTAHAEVLNRFARWHILRRMRQHATKNTLTSSVVNGGRSDIRAASRLLAWLEQHHITVSELTQGDLERYLAAHPTARSSGRGFLIWLGTSRTNTRIALSPDRKPAPQVTMTDEARWRGIELLLHDTTINSHSRVAGLFLLLFAWPLNKLVRMTHDQVTTKPDGRVIVTFEKVPIELPPLVGPIVLAHMNSYGAATYRVGDTAWLFPGRHPGRPIATEPIRRVLVEQGIHPRASRSAAMFALAGQIPAPVLADLVDISPGKAVQWAKLAARDWSDYVTARPRRRPE
jgi:hypothetical protein